MKFRLFLIMFLVILTPCLSTAFEQSHDEESIGQYDMSKYFPLHQGNEWTYLMNGGGGHEKKVVIDGTEMIDGINTIRMRAVGSYSDYVFMTEEGLKQYKDADFGTGDYRMEDTPVLEFPLIIRVGDSFRDRHSWTSFYANGELEETGTTEIIGRLEAVEDVTVPIGTFWDCLKIFYFGAYTESDGDIGHYLEIKWFAKGIGIIKKFRSEKTERFSGETESFTQEWRLKGAMIDGVQVRSGK